ncbi:hypothetical protein, conserved [Eimeria maxima]|uniref:RAP domain-containing protein n=1 Tax=Eimeria maxima TaxID=5804 RepID=U6MEE4_EIMMA|nr:hypothetical protein, conserved [Eimeria maxima]CDJ61438.1 hypothetical protein, conserved [Eimeria maxima]
MGQLRPRDRLLKSAIAAETRLRYKGRRMHKRFRSWSQHRVRQYWLPQRVSLHADTADMSPAYLAAAVQKAATLRKHDVALWFNFSRRAQQVADTCTPQQLGYLFYGFGKARFLDPPLYACLLRYAVSSLEDFASHSLMTVPWALSRVAIREVSALTEVGQETVLKAAHMRPGDLIKVAVGLAKLRLSSVLLPALKDASALDFRNSMHPLAVIGLYTQPLQTFVMERFSNLRRILHPIRRPSPLHWEVSDCLAALGIAHRNTFHWGCFWIDIGEAGDRRRCIFVDGPAAFYTNSTQYTEAVKLQHRVLSDLGWEVRRVLWFDWVGLEGKQQKIEFLRKLRASPALPSFLPDPLPGLTAQEVQQRLHLVKQRQREQQEAAAAAVGDSTVDLDL